MNKEMLNLIKFKSLFKMYVYTWLKNNAKKKRITTTFVRPSKLLTLIHAHVCKHDTYTHKILTYITYIM